MKKFKVTDKNGSTQKYYADSKSNLKAMLRRKLNKQKLYLNIEEIKNNHVDVSNMPKREEQQSLPGAPECPICGYSFWCWHNFEAMRKRMRD